MANKSHLPFVQNQFQILKKSFGPQGWWPTRQRPRSPARYQPWKRPGTETEREKFEICLGAILTQNTTWSNASRALDQLAQNRLLNFSALKKASLNQIEKNIRSAGYYRQKAKKLKSFLAWLGPVGKVSARLRGDLSLRREELLSVFGIGPETADSILLYAGGKPIFVVDAYTKRIGARWGLFSERSSYEAVQRLFSKGTQGTADYYGEFHALLVELAKRFCLKKNPDCLACPVRKRCRTGIKTIGRRSHA